MDGFLSWFLAFLTTMLGGVWKIISNLFKGIVQIFNFPAYFNQLIRFSGTFTALDWIFTIFSLILTFAIWAVIITIFVILIRKYIRFRHSRVGNEDLLEEMADLHRDVMRLTREKEKIIAMKVGQSNLTMEQLGEIFKTNDDEFGMYDPYTTGGTVTVTAASGDENAVPEDSGKRFFRLSAVDSKYEFYIPPQYDTTIGLSEICDDFRNFACSRMRLYYDIRTIRFMFAGLASTKMILLQGISGTGKTSLPYAMGKYFDSDATISSVQPSWRDRTELFGYFNEFTKKFNETEFLKRVYESSYNDDVNIVVLDEMNIARVEYYFAEMLSLLEMPDPNEWKLEIVASSWPEDPKHLEDGKLKIPQNVWYVGTANNDDSTFAVSDKVYDRAFVIDLDSKGLPFDAPDTPPRKVSYSHIADLYKQAVQETPMPDSYLDKISSLDLYVIQKFRVAFGNRIMKQMKIFVPVYVACGGDIMDGIDHMLATKVFRKFDALNLSLVRDEIKPLIAYMDSLFGPGVMRESIAFLERLQKTY